MQAKRPCADAHVALDGFFQFLDAKRKHDKRCGRVRVNGITLTLKSQTNAACSVRSGREGKLLVPDADEGGVRRFLLQPEELSALRKQGLHWNDKQVLDEMVVENWDPLVTSDAQAGT